MERLAKTEFKTTTGKCWSIIGLLLLLCFALPSLASEQKLEFVVHPYKTPTKLIAAYTPFVEYLGKKLNREIELRISKNYEAHIESIAKGRVDFAYIGPAAYVELTRRFGQFPMLARQFINGRPYFSGKIIIRKNSAIHQLSDLKGKRFAFGDPASTMSHLVPRYMLSQAGVDVSSLEVYKFLGSHDNVALGVLSGDFDAGAVKEAVFYRYENRGLQALATTPELSEHLFVAKKNMDPALVQKIKGVMHEMSKDSEGLNALKKIKESISSLGEVEDKDYDNLRDILNRLRDMGL